MTSFFSKPKAEPSISLAGNESPEATDFDKVFKPFALKKGVKVAPINYFCARRKSLDGVEENPIVVFDDETPLFPPPVAVKRSPPSSLPGMTHIPPSQWAPAKPLPQDRLRDIIFSMPRTNPSRRGIRAFRPKPNDSVRAILSELAEAEVAGDISTTRSLLNLLEDRAAIPAKVLIFHEDTRPGYLGTWTRISSSIRPRRPLARDVVVIDYSYDSSEEWEEETPGDADDIADDNDEDDEGDAEDDSDADSWLVDDDNAEIIIPVDQVETVPLSKRRFEGTTGASSSCKKRRVVPLVPFVKGPAWDPAITKTVEEVFTPFRVRFFNGMFFIAHFNIDSNFFFSKTTLAR